MFVKTMDRTCLSVLSTKWSLFRLNDKVKPFQLASHVVSVQLSVYPPKYRDLVRFSMQIGSIFLQQNMWSVTRFGSADCYRNFSIRSSLNNKNIDFAGSFTNYFQICATTPTGFSSICYKTDRILEYVQQCTTAIAYQKLNIHNPPNFGRRHNGFPFVLFMVLRQNAEVDHWFFKHQKLVVVCWASNPLCHSYIVANQTKNKMMNCDENKNIFQKSVRNIWKYMIQGFQICIELVHIYLCCRYIACICIFKDG